MSLTDGQKSDLTFKKIVTDKSTSDITKQYFEEANNSRRSIFLTDIWTQSDLIPSTAAEVPGVVQKITDLSLTNIEGTNSFTDAALQSIIPFNFGDGSYQYELKTDANVAVPFGFKDWFFDPDGGVLTFFDGLSSSGAYVITANTPPKITCYKYIGDIGDFSNISAGSTEVEEIITVSTNGQTAFILSNNSTIVDFLQVNGVEQIEGTDYSVTGTSLTWSSADFDLETTDYVRIRYTYNI